MWLLYRALVALLLATVGPVMMLLRGRHYLPALRGRLARELPSPGARPLWIHAVSVGESAVAATLSRLLPAELPLLVTTTTATGQARARRAFAGRAAVGYFPFELASSVERFYDATDPRALILVEGDYWPLVMREARRRGIPILVVNGRISGRTFRRLRLFPLPVRRALLGAVRCFGVQSTLDRDRLLALGVEASRVEVTGNLKFEASEPTAQPELSEWLQELGGSRPFLVAGSTMPGEEAAVLEAFELARKMIDAILVIAPRHPERFDEVDSLLRNRFPNVVRRSGTDGGTSGRAEVALLDTLGELPAVYAHAHAAFIGGSLVPRGGHNPLEAARFAVPVAVGPSMENFHAIAEGFDRAAAWARVRDGRELGETWQRWLLDRASAAEIGRRGADLVAANRGALEHTRRLVRELLDSASPDSP